MKAQEFLNKFSSKKDALSAIDVIISVVLPISEDTYEYYIELRKEVESYKDNDLACKVLELYNDVNKTQYKNLEKINTIIRQVPKSNIDQFESIIIWCKDVWGNDPVMSQYNTPYTIFGSKQKFQKYLETATNYWIQKAKKNDNTTY